LIEFSLNKAEDIYVIDMTFNIKEMMIC